MLDYCKKHSSKKTYKLVAKSFKKTVVSIIAILFFLITIFAIGAIYFSKRVDEKVTKNNINYSFEKIGHVGNAVIWYIDNVKYEIDISNFGYNIDDYEHGSDFYVYLDENHNVVDITPIVKSDITATDKMIFWLLGSLISMCIILITFTIWVRYSKSKLNPMREWVAFTTWFKNKPENEDWYNGYSY